MDSLHGNRRFEGRPRKIIPLHEPRARRLQGNDFRFGLHALHHQLDVQLPAQPDRMNNNGPPRLIRVAILHHRAVQLHRVGLQIRKPGQAGKTAAEIIHGNLKANLAVFVDNPLQVINIRQILLLDNLERQPIQRETGSRGGSSGLGYAGRRFIYRVR